MSTSICIVTATQRSTTECMEGSPMTIPRTTIICMYRKRKKSTWNEGTPIITIPHHAWSRPHREVLKITPEMLHTLVIRSLCMVPNVKWATSLCMVPALQYRTVYRAKGWLEHLVKMSASLLNSYVVHKESCCFLCREQLRTTSFHTALPWATMYVCV